jgi:hypothetical protein
MGEEAVTFNQLWDQLVRKKPDLSDDGAKVTITSLSLKAMLRQAYEQGQLSKPASSAVSEKSSRSSFADIINDALRQKL